MVLTKCLWQSSISFHRLTVGSWKECSYEQTCLREECPCDTCLPTVSGCFSVSLRRLRLGPRAYALTPWPSYCRHQFVKSGRPKPELPQSCSARSSRSEDHRAPGQGSSEPPCLPQQVQWVGESHGGEAAVPWPRCLESTGVRGFAGSCGGQGIQAETGCAQEAFHDSGLFTDLLGSCLISEAF